MSDPKDYLRKMIDNTIKNDTEAAAQNFKDYIIPATIDRFKNNDSEKSNNVADSDGDKE